MSRRAAALICHCFVIAAVLTWSAAPAHAAGRLFATSFGVGIIEINPATGAVLNTFAPPIAQGVNDGLAFDGTSLWFLSGSQDSNTLYQLDPDTGATVNSYALPANTSRDGLAALNGLVYIAHSSAIDQDVAVFNPGSGTIINTIDINGANPGIFFSGAVGALRSPDALLLPGAVNSTIYLVNPVSGATLSSFNGMLAGDIGLAGIGDEVFVGKNSGLTEQIFVYSRTGTELRRLSVSGSIGLQSLAGADTAVTPIASAPNPRSGSGMRQVFQFNFTDPDGAANLDVVNVLVNDFLDGRNACYIGYSRPANTLFLVDDLGGGANLAALPLNGSGAVNNSQCTIHGSGTSASTSGNTLTLNIDMEFTNLFLGRRIVHVAARDLDLNNSGWDLAGVFDVKNATPPTNPYIESVTPSAGAGSRQAFTVVYKNTDASLFRATQLLLNNALDGRNACYLGYDVLNNLLYLVPDDGSPALLGPVQPNSGVGTVQNSQCVIHGVGSTSQLTANQLTLTIDVEFKNGFQGSKIGYAGAQTTTANTGWHALTAWTAQ